MSYEKLSPHFALAEFLPPGVDEENVPTEVLVNLELLVEEILEPLRSRLSMPVVIHSGYRPPEYNARVGGKPHSDHQLGNACDFHCPAAFGRTWQQSTLYAFNWIRTQLDGRFGQLILEDHRIFRGSPTKLWVHVSNPTHAHPGTPDDVNRLLISSDPDHYIPYDQSKMPVE